MQRGFYRQYAELEDHHWWFVGRRCILQHALDDSLGAASGLRVLDFGCGTGGWLRCLDRYGTVSAVDADDEAVSFARSRGREDVSHVPSGQPLPFAQGTFGLVTALDVLEHIDDDVAAVRDLHRVAQPGALLLVTVPAFAFLWGDQDEISHHFRRYAPAQLQAVLEEGGFTVEHVSCFNSALFPVVAAVRMIRRLLRGSRTDRTDFDLGPAWANRPLTWLLGAEAGLVVRRRVPFGVSVLALARARPYGTGTDT